MTCSFPMTLNLAPPPGLPWDSSHVALFCFLNLCVQSTLVFLKPIYTCLIWWVRTYNILTNLNEVTKHGWFQCCSDQNLQLLFTVAQSSGEAAVRSNCIIALGDLAFRFPNVLEPWTEHMYARLSDKDRKVRKNAVLVLTHLILNDMVKVPLLYYSFLIVSKILYNPSISAEFWMQK